MTSPTPTALVRRPRVLVFDVNETLSDMTHLGDRFVEVGVPPYVTFGDMRNGTAGLSGYLGTGYNPFVIEGAGGGGGNAAAGRPGASFRVRGISLDGTRITLTDLENRDRLLRNLDTGFRSVDRSSELRKEKVLTHETLDVHGVGQVAERVGVEVRADGDQNVNGQTRQAGCGVPKDVDAAPSHCPEGQVDQRPLLAVAHPQRQQFTRVTPGQLPGR